MSTPTTIAFIGATGGAGTTRLSLELAVTPATDDRDVTVLSTAFATQGLSNYVPGTLDPDATAFVADAADMPLESGLVALGADTEGRVAVCPAAAPFERLVRATTPDAARALEGRITETVDGFDHVLADAPLLASNQTAAATAACGRAALITPAANRGADAVGRLSTQAADINTDIDAVIFMLDALDDADVVASGTETTGLADAPACREDAELTADVAATAEALLDIEVDTVAATNDVLGSVNEYVRR